MPRRSALLDDLAFAHVLERPAKMHFEPSLHVTKQKSLYIHWDPPYVGDLLEPPEILGAGVFAFFLREAGVVCRSRSVCC